MLRHPNVPVPWISQPFPILSAWRYVGFLILATSQMKDPENLVILAELIAVGVRSASGETSENPAVRNEPMD